MKQVKSKITGDIAELDFDSREGTFIVVRYDLHTKKTIKDYYKNLEDLCEDWEDYEEPKYWYMITPNGGVQERRIEDDIHIEDCKEIGNYFETKEEAKQAVEKLKAWKRLRDKMDIRIVADISSLKKYPILCSKEDHIVDKEVDCKILLKDRLSSFDDGKQCANDFKLIFGGEE